MYINMQITLRDVMTELYMKVDLVDAYVSALAWPFVVINRKVYSSASKRQCKEIIFAEKQSINGS